MKLVHLRSFPDVKSKDFTRERTQALRAINKNYILINKFNKFDFTDSKMEKISNEHHYSGANKKIMDINNKRDKSPETLRLIEKGQEITKTATFGLFLAVTWTQNCGYPDERTKEEEMRQRQLIWNHWLAATEETDGAVESSSLTNRGPARAQRETDENPRKCVGHPGK